MSKKSYDDGAAAEFIRWFRGPELYISTLGLVQLTGIASASRAYQSTVGTSWMKLAENLGSNETGLVLTHNRMGTQRNYTRIYTKRAAAHIVMNMRQPVGQQFREWLCEAVMGLADIQHLPITGETIYAYP